MIKQLLAGATVLASAQAAGAVGLDRSNQDITAIFETGNYAELSYGFVTPDVTGSDLAGFGGFTYGNVADEFTQLGASLKYDINEQFSIALILDQPFGANILYPGDPASSMLGGTEALLESRALTAVARYRINDRFSIHGGLRHERLNARIGLSGLAYGGLSGYDVMLDDSEAYGYLVGAAYEIPDIALRLAVTYNSSMEHEFDTTETVGGIPVNLIDPRLSPTSTTTVETPEAINIDFQTGIAPNTLVFANIRHAMYSQTLVSPEFFAAATGGASLTDIDDGTAYTLGVARRFNDAFAATVSVGFEPEGDNLVSPLAPTNGNRSLAIGGQYTINDIVLSGGVRYTWLGDAQPETGTPDVARADFTDNTALAVGLSVGFRF